MKQLFRKVMGSKAKEGEAGHRCEPSGSGEMVWFLGAIGAAVYYIQQAQSFSEGVLGILKALVWPAILVYQLFQYLG